METKQLSETVWVSGQIAPSDLETLKGAGFDLVINNRPDGESPDQPLNADLAKRADELGLKFVYIPTIPGQVDRDAVARFQQALAGNEGKVLAFCRTGGRSANLWALSQA